METEKKQPTYKERHPTQKSLETAVWNNKGSKGDFKTLSLSKNFTRDDGKTWEKQTISLTKEQAQATIQLLQNAVNNMN